MGLDWVPARPRAGVDLGALRRLAQAQARAARVQVGIEDGCAALADESERLAAGLDIATGSDGHWPSFRVAVVGYNPLFPPEWRAGAYTTLFPDEAAAAVGGWRRWYAELSAGRMRHYRERLAVWDTGRRLHEVQAALADSAARSLARSTAWTRSERFGYVRDAVARLPAPPPVVWPGPPPAGAGDDEPAPDQHDRAEELSVHLGLVTDAVRAFNRAVPRAFKCPCPEPLPALDAPVRDGWLEEFFDWVDPIVHSGHGLYLRASATPPLP